jgi:voltage-gated potassium channel
MRSGWNKHESTSLPASPSRLLNHPTMTNTQATAPPLRGRLTKFVNRHILAWDLVMGVLTVIYVVLAFSEDAPTGPQAYAVWALAGVFLLEFGARCYDSTDRAQYLRSHWLDLITAVPVPGIPGLRIIRLLRLLRFLKVGVLIRRMLLSRGWDQGGLIWPTLFIFWIASALALWLVEHDAPGTSITTFPEAMTAAFLTAATLGFGKHSLPVTQDGQIIAALIVFFALGLWGFASSNLTRLWLNAREDEAHREIDLILHELQAIGEQLKHLTVDVLERPTSEALPKDDEPSAAADVPQFTRP